MLDNAKKLIVDGFLTRNFRIGKGRFIFRSLLPNEIECFDTLYPHGEQDRRIPYCNFVFSRSLIAFSIKNRVIDFRLTPQLFSEFELQSISLNFPFYFLEMILYVQTDLLFNVMLTTKWMETNRNLVESHLKNTLIGKTKSSNLISRDLGESELQILANYTSNQKKFEQITDYAWQGLKFLGSLVNPKAIQQIEAKEKANKEINEGRVSNKDYETLKNEYGENVANNMIISEERDLEISDMVKHGLSPEEAKNTDYHEWAVGRWEKNQQLKVDEFKQSFSSSKNNKEGSIFSSMKIITEEELNKIKQLELEKIKAVKNEFENQQFNQETKVFNTLRDKGDDKLDAHDRAMKKWEEDNYNKLLKQREVSKELQEDGGIGVTQRLISPEEFFKIQKIAKETVKEQAPGNINIHNIDRYIKGE